MIENDRTDVIVNEVQNMFIFKYWWICKGNAYPIILKSFYKEKQKMPSNPSFVIFINLLYWLSIYWLLTTLYEFYQKSQVNLDKGKDGGTSNEQDQNMNIGNSSNNFLGMLGVNYKPEAPTNIRFSDVLGIEEHLEELKELVFF